MSQNDVPQVAQQRPREVTPYEQAVQQLDSMAIELRKVLPAQIPVERFVRTAQTAIRMQPELLDADKKSLFDSVLRCAQDGLLPDKKLAAFVVFNTKSGRQVQYMPMIAGILQKLRNSGQLVDISANVVYEKDLFDYELGDEPRITHKPLLADDRGRPVAAYAIARTKDGGRYREVMSFDQIERVRAVSRAKNAGPWVDWWDEQARKTVLRRLCKILPSSTDLLGHFEADDEQYDFSSESPNKAAAEARATAKVAPMQALKAKLGVKVEAAPPAAESVPEPQPEAAAQEAAPVSAMELDGEIREAESVEALDAIGQRIAACKASLSATERRDLAEAFAERKAILEESLP